MKILIVSLFFPQKMASHAGGRYVYEIVKNLSQNHEVYLATRIEEQEYSSLESLKPYCHAIFPYSYRPVAKRGLFDTISLVCNYIGFSRYADRLICEGKYNLIQVEWVEAALLIGRGKTPMALDAHDVITKPAARQFDKGKGINRIIKYLGYIMVKRLELTIARKFQVIFTRSEFDNKYLRQMDDALRVITVPHPAGLDITDKVYEPRKNTILFIASFKYRRVNVEAALWFYREVFTLVRKEVPEARFIIAGYGPPEELTCLAQSDLQVSVTGFVDDLDRCYKEAAVFVAPILTGGGIIVKILDALAAGTPVVSTTFGNEGIRAVPGHDLLVADTPKAFAAAVVRFLMEKEFARQIGENGQEFVRKNYSLESVMKIIESAYDEMVSPGEDHNAKTISY